MYDLFMVCTICPFIGPSIDESVHRFIDCRFSIDPETSIDRGIEGLEMSVVAGIQRTRWCSFCAAFQGMRHTRPGGCFCGPVALSRRLVLLSAAEHMHLAGAAGGAALGR